MEVNDPDFALESATHAQPQARELCKIAALNANFLPNAPVSELIGKSSHVNAPQESQYGTASSHEQSDSDESMEDLEKSTEWILTWVTLSQFIWWYDPWLTPDIKSYPVFRCTVEIQRGVTRPAAAARQPGTEMNETYGMSASEVISQDIPV